jgi:hypothetical protein
LVRCPECGRFIAANEAATAMRPWLNRLTGLALAAWVLGITGCFLLLFMAEGSLSYSTLDELTVSGGYTVRRAGTSITYIRSGSAGPTQLRADHPDYRLFVTVVITVSALVAFAAGALSVVVFPHWPRAAYLLLVTAMPVLAGAIVVISWHYDAPHLLGWSLQYVFGHAIAQFVGGWLGVTLGRPAARTLVRIFFPPGVRPRLAYLWLADEKPLPRAE